MASEQPVLPILEKAWTATCRVLLGEELGKLTDFEGWLTELPEPAVYHKSSVSEKEVAYAVGKYCEGAKWISLGEVDYSEKFAPLSINDMKDIDSVLAAVTERAMYAGGVVLGKSAFVEKSSNASDSFYVYQCGRVSDSKYVAYSAMVKDCEHIFGGDYKGKAKHSVRGSLDYKCSRTLDLWNADDSNDCYYSCNIRGCSEILFSFNLWGKKHVIGNLELPREQYFALKKKLLSEIAGELRKNKTFPSIGRLVLESSKGAIGWKGRIAGIAQPAVNASPINEAFAKTTSLLFGKSYAPVEKYGEWLARDMIVRIISGKSALSGLPVFMGDFRAGRLYPKGRLVTFDEARELGGKLQASREEIEHLSVGNLAPLLGKIGYMTPEFREGVGRNIIECPIYADASDCMRCYDATFSKFCAYCFWARDSERLFGTSMAFSSSFCVKCYNSSRITRCFEVDSSSDCSGCYYCHNCENVHDSMFCFNVKNKRYAIGNVEIGPERFAAAKKMLLEWICRQLDARQEVKTSIFEVGCFKGKN